MKCHIISIEAWVSEQVKYASFYQSKDGDMQHHTLNKKSKLSIIYMEIIYWLQFNSNKCRTTYTVFCLFLVISFLCLISVNFYTEIITIFLPMHLTVCYIEQVTDTKLFSTGYLYQWDTSWSIQLLRNPKGNDVICWRPSKVSMGKSSKMIS